MLEAYLHNKIDVELSEDTLTSSIFGILQYSIEDLAFIVKLITKREITNPKVNFWPHLSSKGTSNANFVEPDVLIEADNINIVVEVKKDDFVGQSIQQWKNEIVSVKNDYPEKEVLLIAIGGKIDHFVVNENIFFHISWVNFSKLIVENFNGLVKCKILNILSLYNIRSDIGFRNFFNSIEIYRIDLKYIKVLSNYRKNQK